MIRSTPRIIGLMSVAMIFGVIGAEVRSAQAKSTGGILADPFLVFFGGTVATALLVMTSMAGKTGQSFGTGIAGLAAVGSILLNGRPVFDLIAKTTSPPKQTPPGKVQTA